MGLKICKFLLFLKFISHRGIYPLINESHSFVQQESVSKNKLLYQQGMQLLIFEIRGKSWAINNPNGLMQSEMWIQLLIKPKLIYNSTGVSQTIGLDDNHFNSFILL